MKRMLAVLLTTMMIAAVIMPTQAHEVTAAITTNDGTLVPLDYKFAKFAEIELELPLVPTLVPQSQANSMRSLLQTCEYIGIAEGVYYQEIYGTHSDYWYSTGEFEIYSGYDDHAFFNGHQHYGSFYNEPPFLSAYDYDETDIIRWACNDSDYNYQCNGSNNGYHVSVHPATAEFRAYLYCDYWGYPWQNPNP